MAKYQDTVDLVLTVRATFVEHTGLPQTPEAVREAALSQLDGVAMDEVGDGQRAETGSYTIDVAFAEVVTDRKVTTAISERLPS